METLGRNKFIALVFTVCLLIAAGSVGFTVYAATHPSFTTTIETGSMVDTASYVIFRDGSTYFAKNGTTGEIRSGTNVTTIVSNVIGEGDCLIHFDDGTFELVISLSNDTYIEGNGRGVTILKLPDGKDTHVISAKRNVQNVGISDLTIDGNSAEQTVASFAQGIYLTNRSEPLDDDPVENFIVQNVETKNTLKSGIVTGHNGIVKDVWCHDSAEDHGIYASISQNVSISNAYVWDNYQSGIKFGTTSDSYAEDCTLEMSYSFNNGHDSSGHGIEVVYSKGITTETSHSFNNTGSGIGVVISRRVNIENCKVKYNDGYGITIDRSSSCIVEGNTATWNHQSNILLISDASYNATDNIVSNNIAKNSQTEDGIKLRADEGYVLNSLITGNRCFDDQDTKTQLWGIREVGNIDYSIIGICNCRDNSDGGIKVVGTDTYVCCSWNGTNWISEYPVL